MPKEKSYYTIARNPDEMHLFPDLIYLLAVFFGIYWMISIIATSSGFIVLLAILGIGFILLGGKKFLTSNKLRMVG